MAEKDLEEILTDHAYCEQKAASTAISLIVQFPEYPDLVSKMADLVQEEMDHFKRVHDFIQERGLKLGRERKDEYVNQLAVYFKKSGKSRIDQLVDKLLFCAMIEARSCERFRVLSENISDQELSDFYFELMKSEAAHYSMFLLLAKDFQPADVVDEKWNALLDFEGELIQSFGKSVGIHG